MVRRDQPDAKILVVGGQDRVLQLFDVESWHKLDEVIAYRRLVG